MQRGGRDPCVKVRWIREQTHKIKNTSLKDMRWSLRLAIVIHEGERKVPELTESNGRTGLRSTLEHGLNDLGMVFHTCDISIWEPEAEGLPWVSSYPGLHNDTISTKNKQRKLTKEGLEHGSGVKSTCCFCRRLGWVPSTQPSVCNSSFCGADALFWHLRGPGINKMYAEHSYT